MAKRLKTVSLDTMIDKFVDKRGSNRRESFENRVKSKFTIWVVLIMVLAVVFSGVTILVVVGILSRRIHAEFSGLVGLALIAFSAIWLVFGELRTKAIVVTLSHKEIIVAGYLGIAKPSVYQFADFDHFHTANLSSKYSTYEYLYFLHSGRRRFAISQFYHRNYRELKGGLLNLGYGIDHRDVSLLEHVKDIFN